MIEKSEAYFLPVAVFLALTLSLLRFSSIPVGTFFDDANYLILAEGLVTGSGYRLINFPSMPTEQAFPPGWPLLLAPIVGLAPGNLLLPKMLTLLFSLGSIFLADRLFRDRLEPTERLFFLLLISLNPLFIGAAGTVMSEPAYLFFSLLTLVLLEHWMGWSMQGGHGQADLGPAHPYGWLIKTGLILFCAFFSMVVRTVGITLLLAVIVMLIPKQKWRPVLLIGGGIGILGGLAFLLLPQFFEDIFLFSPLYLGHVQYLLGEFGGYLQFWNHLSTFDWPSIGNVIVPVFDLNLSFVPFWETIKRVVPLLLLVLVFIGWFLQWGSFRPTDLYFLFFVGLFYLWTAYINEVQQRQLIPMIPLVSFYIVKVAGGRWRMAGFVGNKLYQLGIASCLLILLVHVGRNVQQWQNPVSELVVDYEVGGRWLRENTEPQVVYAVNYPRPSYLYSRRSTEYLPVDLEGAAFDAYVAQRDITYILIQPDLADWHSGELRLHPNISGYLEPYLLENDKYRSVFVDSDAQVQIFEVVGD